MQNRSLQTIRQKWFSLATQKSADTSELQSFLSELDAISPELLKNVINLADDNVRFALLCIYVSTLNRFMAIVYSCVKSVLPSVL